VQRAGLAAALQAHEQAIIQQYRMSLEALGSPLVRDEIVWRGLSIQARRIVEDCADTLRADRVRLPDTQSSSVDGMTTWREGPAIHPRHFVRASIVLFDVVLWEVRDTVGDRPDAAQLLSEVSHTLSHGIGARLAAGAVGHDEFLLNHVRGVVDTGRKQLARDIHDRLGNSVSLAMRYLELGTHQAGTSRPVEAEHVNAARVVLGEALAEMRDLITGLRRGRVEGALQAALAAYVASVRVNQPVVSVAVRGMESWAPPETLDEVFTILRESLRNVFAHANADRASLRVDVAPHELSAVVEDDGKGFDPGRPVTSGGSGLASMRERADALRGHLSIQAGAHGGTRVMLWAPLAGNG
jgi:signal transduction histidine kinase